MCTTTKQKCESDFENPTVIRNIVRQCDVILLFPHSIFLREAFLEGLLLCTINCFSLLAARPIILMATDALRKQTKDWFIECLKDPANSRCADCGAGGTGIEFNNKIFLLCSLIVS